MFRIFRCRLLVSVACACAAAATAGECADSNTVKNAVEKAKQCEARGDFAGAADEYKHALNSDPDNNALRAGLLGAYAKMGNNSALNPQLHIHIGQALEYVNDLWGAEAQFRRAIELSPGKHNPEAEQLLKSLLEAEGQPAEIDESSTKTKVMDANQDKRNNPPAQSPIKQNVDWGTYMADLQRRIKRAWFPPKRDESIHVKVEFKIHRGGDISNLRVSNSSNILIVDQAAIMAVENAAPLRPLPAGSPENIDIMFTFDYNVFGGPAIARNAGVGVTIPQSTAEESFPTPTDVDRLNLNRPEDRRLAESFAESYEAAGNYSSAQKLYERILAAPIDSTRLPEDRRYTVRLGLARVKLFTLVSQTFEGSKVLPKLIECLRQLDDAPMIRTTTRAALEQRLARVVVRSRISNQEFNDALRDAEDLSASTKLSFVQVLIHTVTSEKDTRLHLKELSSIAAEYTSIIDGAAHADEIARNAFELECKGQYALATAQYKAALAIRERILGSADPDILSQRGDVARVLGAEGHISDSMRLYTSAIDGFRKKRSTSYQYVRLLQSYGDMLNHAHLPKLASAAYLEAQAVDENNSLK